MSAKGRIKNSTLLLIDRITSRYVSKFTSNSFSIRKSNCRHLRIRESDVDVIYRGRNLSDFCANSEIRQSADFVTRARTDPTILSLARLDPQKNQRELIQAMPYILNKIPRAHLRIVGTGPLHDELKDLSRKMGVENHVTLAGFSLAPISELEKAHVCVSSSLFEGLPGSIIEAILAGIPVVLSDIDPHRELAPDGSLGKTYPLGSCEALAGAVIEVLLDYPKSAEIARQAQASSRRLFNIDAIADAHDTLYSSFALK